MRPSGNYFTFSLAAELGRTVRELLTGQPGPMTHTEWYLWARYRMAQRRLEQQQRKKR